MRRLHNCAAKLDDTGGADIHIGDGNESLPPGWTRPRKICGGIHHAADIFAVVFEERVDTKWAGINLAPSPAQQPIVEITALFLVCRYELVPEEGSVLGHMVTYSENVARTVSPCNV